MKLEEQNLAKLDSCDLALQVYLWLQFGITLKIITVVFLRKSFVAVYFDSARRLAR